MTNFKIGDVVVVVDNDQTYTSYTKKFKELGFKNLEENECFENGTVAFIFAESKHNNDGIQIFAIQDYEGNQSLINIIGIEHIEYEPVTENIIPEFIN